MTESHAPPGVETEIAAVTRASRRWLGRAARWLAMYAGIRQFLDVGSGLPADESPHTTVREANAAATFVYLDDDPEVCARGRALLDANRYASFSRAFFCHGDPTRPEDVLADPAVTTHLDLRRPVALLQPLTLHHVPELKEAQEVMHGYLDALAGGSYVALTHAHHPPPDSPDQARILAAYAHCRETDPDFTIRGVDDIASLLPGLELVEPGIVPVADWWPDGPSPEPPPLASFIVGGVARKP